MSSYVAACEKVLGELKNSGVNLLAFTAFPVKGGKAQVDLVAENMAALNAYYRARSLITDPRSGFTPRAVIDQLEQAVELAPEFVEAWSTLAWRMALDAARDPAAT